MQHRNFRYLLYLLLAAPPAFAADSTRRTVKPADWARMTDDGDFFYRTMTERAALPPKPPNGLAMFLQRLLMLLANGWGQLLAWVLVAGLLLFLIYWILKNRGAIIFGRRNRQMAADMADTDEDDLEGTDWDGLLQQAVAGGNQKLAVRYAYKHLLQLLQHNQLIQYRQDKTNQEYYHELKSNDYRQAFRLLSRTYEYAWYGGYAVTPEIWQRFSEAFVHFKKRLGA